MTNKPTQPWVSLDKIELFVQVEPALVILCLVLAGWISARVFLHLLTPERRRNLKTHFRNLGFHLVLGFILSGVYFVLNQVPSGNTIVEKLTIYSGLALILSGAAIFVKACRILLFEYLFLSHRKVAFPVLLVNLFTLLISIILTAWIGAELFNIRLTPILATSAIFSLVLGLALQDTLGNLFAGVALQLDKPYEIGDWIEIQSTGQKWVGQVREISWRATVLISFTEESITVPNRVMAQAEISNFSTKFRPIIRSLIFRLPFEAQIERIRELLNSAARTIPDLRKIPSPFVLISETNESWVGFKLVYYIDNYGDQFIIADKVYTACLTQLETAGFKLANHRVTLSQPTHSTG